MKFKRNYTLASDSMPSTGSCLQVHLGTPKKVFKMKVFVPDYFKRVVIFVVVDTHDKHWSISTGGRNDDSLGTTFQMSLMRSRGGGRHNQEECMVQLTC